MEILFKDGNTVNTVQIARYCKHSYQPCQLLERLIVCLTQRRADQVESGLRLDKANGKDVTKMTKDSLLSDRFLVFFSTKVLLELWTAGYGGVRMTKNSMRSNLVILTTYFYSVLFSVRPGSDCKRGCKEEGLGSQKDAGSKHRSSIGI